MDLQALEKMLSDQPAQPPIEQWHPEPSGAIDIRIDREGIWHHEGDRIRRQPLVNLFASILRRESDGDYYLVTPVEKWRISVEDAPLIATTVEAAGSGAQQQVVLTLNTGAHVPLDAAHPLHIRGESDSPRPYVELERGLEARVGRSAYYQLVDLAETRGRETGIESFGHWFSLD